MSFDKFVTISYHFACMKVNKLNLRAFSTDIVTKLIMTLLIMTSLIMTSLIMTLLKMTLLIMIEN
jgi:hypothetical protein